MNNFIDLHINSDLPDTSLDKPRPFNWRRGTGRLSLLFFFLLAAALTAGTIMEAQAQSLPTAVPATFVPNEVATYIAGTLTAEFLGGATALPPPLSTATPPPATFVPNEVATYIAGTLTAEFLGVGVGAVANIDSDIAVEVDATALPPPLSTATPPPATFVPNEVATYIAGTLTAEFLGVGVGAVANIDSDIAVEVDAAATALALMVSTPNHRIMVSNRCDGPPQSESERQACDTYKALYRERYGNPCRTNAQGEAVCVH